MNINSKRPFVTISAAASLDGYIDDLSDRPLILSNSADLSLVDGLRAAHQAIMVGASTIRKDNPKLTLKDSNHHKERSAKGLSPDPVKVTWTESGRLPKDALFFTEGAAQKLVFCPKNSAPALLDELRERATIISCPEPNLELAWVLQELASRGIESLLIEGGEKLLTQAIVHGLYDKMRVAIAPIYVSQEEAPRLFKLPGGQPQPALARLNLLSVERVGDMAVMWFGPAS